MIFNLKLNCIGHMDVLRILIENGIDINGQNDKNSTALHLAASKGKKWEMIDSNEHFSTDSIKMIEKWFPSR